MSNYEIIEAGQGRFVKAWRKGVYFEQEAIQQLINAARLSIVTPYVAAMPDCHKGYGSTVGSVIPTLNAVIPAAVGVDIGCGMVYQSTNIRRASLPADLAGLRKQLSDMIPNGGPGLNGSWPELVPGRVRTKWMREFSEEYDALMKRHPGARSDLAMRQLGTLGTGNHFVELVTAGEDDSVGILIHSGSRGLGNKIGSYFTNVAQEICKGTALPDRDLAYLMRGTPEFDDYIQALNLAQRYAWESRLIMLNYAAVALSTADGLAQRAVLFGNTIHCHHNYMTEETHQGQKLFITRKGAVKAGLGDMGIIPGSMGARTYIVRGLGSEDSFTSCSHGAGRLMSRTAAKKAFTVEDHAKATAGVECDKTAETLDETPGCYKDIEAVMDAQSDLVERVFSVKQFLCVKGVGEKRHKK
jgi:tRNA-splicing ligase RtcB (3'-phosphate/5'-hydroxy nucleic acid ligase)